MGAIFENLDKIISNFKEQLEDLIIENNINHEKNIKIEQKNSNISLHQSIRSIKIVL